MKKIAWLTVLAVLVLVLGSLVSAQATILPPHGEGQIGLEAVVLCESLTVRQSRDTNSRTVKTLKYGQKFIVMNQVDGWADVVVSDDVDAAPLGWVNADYIAVDPSWYRTDAKTPVYAWDDIDAPKVALLDKGVTLPVLKDDGRWLVVSLRGATGWIRKTAAD